MKTLSIAILSALLVLSVLFFLRLLLSIRRQCQEWSAAVEAETHAPDWDANPNPNPVGADVRRL